MPIRERDRDVLVGVCTAGAATRGCSWAEECDAAGRARIVGDVVGDVDGPAPCMGSASCCAEGRAAEEDVAAGATSTSSCFSFTSSGPLVCDWTTGGGECTGDVDVPPTKERLCRFKLGGGDTGGVDVDCEATDTGSAGGCAGGVGSRYVGDERGASCSKLSSSSATSACLGVGDDRGDVDGLRLLSDTRIVGSSRRGELDGDLDSSWIVFDTIRALTVSGAGAGSVCLAPGVVGRSGSEVLCARPANASPTSRLRKLSVKLISIDMLSCRLVCCSSKLDMSESCMLALASASLAG